MKLEDIRIHCPTQEAWDEVLEIRGKLRLQNPSLSSWSYFKKNSYIKMSKEFLKGDVRDKKGIMSLDEFKNTEHYKEVYPSSKFKIGDIVKIGSLGGDWTVSHPFDEQELGHGRFHPSKSTGPGEGKVINIKDVYVLVELFNTNNYPNGNMLRLPYHENSLTLSSETTKENNSNFNTSNHGDTETTESAIIKIGRLVSRITTGQRPEGNVTRSRASKSSIEIRPISYSNSIVKS